MKSDRRLPVAIVGGGFSGTITAAQLARRGFECVVIEPRTAGLGAAYSTAEPAHLLNVRAASMSAWADQPDHFAHFAGQHGLDPDGFSERRLFGRYLRSILGEASRRVTIVEGKAASATRNGAGWSVRFEDGSEVASRALVLAIGNQAPEALPAFANAGERFIANPWSAAARAAVEAAADADAPVMLVGTGLTMVDVALSLASAGHCGSISAVSRRGLLPRAHADGTGSADGTMAPAGDLVALMRWLRLSSAESGWRAAVDSLRPVTQQLWQSLGHSQQRRFLRHARPWWDVHRHRIAPEVAQQIRSMIEAERLEVIAGRIGKVSPADDSLAITIVPRGGSRQIERRVAYAFNCTGPLGHIDRTRDPLLRQMLDDGLVGADALGIGLDVDERSRAGARLWAVGPPTKGRFWEIVAVPDIRVQAEKVANDIAEELGR